MLNRLLGNRIRNLREEQNLTQEHVAKYSNIDAHKYIAIEEGYFPITLDSLSKIAGALDITVETITSVWDEQYNVKLNPSNDSIKPILDMFDLFLCKQTSGYTIT